MREQEVKDGHIKITIFKNLNSFSKSKSHIKYSWKTFFPTQKDRLVEIQY